MTELSFKIDVYSGEDIPNEEVAKEISSIFINNYPEMYSQETKELDCNRYKTPEQIQQQIIDGNTRITASLDDKVIGIEKSRLENRSNLPHAKEYLCSWLVVDKSYRGQGIAEILINEHLKMLNEIKNDIQEQIFSIADVHKNNIECKNLLEKVGYHEETGKSEDFILARKEII